jgi:hypothetical protein
MVQVYATMVHRIGKSPELLDRLNDINAESMFVRAFWTGDQVVLATEMVADSIDKEQIANACGVVGTVADHYDEELQRDFGGELIFNEEAAARASAAPEEEDETPGYM